MVDDDVDLRHPEEVDYALATRMKPNTDVFIIPGARSNPLDPAADEYQVGKASVAKMIVDATKPLDAPPGAYTMAEVPADALDRVRRERTRYFGG